MRTAFLTGIKKFTLREIPRPGIKGPNEVLVRIRAVGICGSDVHYYRDGRIGDQVIESDIILGHEAAGDVAEVGTDVTSIEKGDRVAIEPGISCGRCESCRTGKPNLCPHVVFLATPPVDGALRDYMVMPEENLVKIPGGLAYNDGVLAEPLAIGLYGVRLGRMQAGDTVAVLGAGPIGLSAAFSAAAAGASRLYVSDPLTPRLNMAETLGADIVIRPPEDDPVAMIKKATGGRGVDIAFEAAGKPETFKQATEVARIGGTVVIFGIPENDRLEFDAHVVRKKELPVISVRRSAHTAGIALGLIKRSHRPFSALVTHTFPLEKISEAFALAAEYKDGVIKAVIAL